MSPNVPLGDVLMAFMMVEKWLIYLKQFSCNPPMRRLNGRIHIHTHAYIHSHIRTHTDTPGNAIRHNAMRFISLKNQVIGKHPLTCLGESSIILPRLLKPLDIVGIGIVRSACKGQRHYVVSDRLQHSSRWFTYAHVNVFDSNLWSWNWRSRTWKIWMKIDWRRYLVNVQCAKIDACRSNRLLAVQNRTFPYRTYGRTNERTNMLPAGIQRSTP